MKAIILAGGFGTRLRSVLIDLPKPMAPIQDKPFLAYLLKYLQQQGVTSVTMAVHYLREKIQAYFQSHYANIEITYAVETEPLGTGGAIFQALSSQQTPEPIFVLNGDTFVKLDYQAMYRVHQQNNASITMALRKTDDCSRYGKILTDGDRITQFKEKSEQGPGFINAGVYLISPDLFSRFTLAKQFSFEKDFLFPYLPLLRARAFIADDYFIDIGVPEDYARAQTELLLSLGEC